MPHFTRREFLQTGALATASLAISVDELHANRPRRDLNCIVLFLVGGPSQNDTFDPHPDAPDNVRGPFQPIQTKVPGILVSEHLPLLAARMNDVAILRSVHHDSAPIHETGQQMLQTGRLFRGGQEYPHVGSVLSHLRGAQGASALVPGPIRNTGVGIGHGQGAAFLGATHDPQFISVNETDSSRHRYGSTSFGDSCLKALRLVERGVRFVTVNMFETVFDKVTWDCHADGNGLASTLDDYKTTLCPTFDRAYAALLDDLKERGMLDSTLVVAMGEFGRTPLMNARGGRDHWPGVWSVLFAGAGVRGGQAIGASDRHGAEPADRPISAAEVTASIYAALGVDPATRIPGPDGRHLSLVDAAAISELFQ